MSKQQPASSATPIRVVHVIQNLNYGGMERVLHSLARQLPARGFEVHIAVFEYLGHFADGLEGSATLHQVPPMSRMSLIHPGQLIKLFRQLRPDIVHSHAGAWMQAARAAKVAQVPVMIHTEHGRPSPVPFADRMVDNIASRWTDTVISVSEPLAALLRREVVHQSTSIKVIMNGVDIDRVRRAADPGALRTELGLPGDALLIGSIGRLEAVKNYQLALRALKHLVSLWSGLTPPTLVIAGDGSERQALEATAVELGISPHVRFLGWRDDAERLYGAFDLFTLTSRSEGTSISLLEAMAADICPVVTDVGGNRNVLGKELEHLLVPDDDAVALGQSWHALLADSQSRKALGCAAGRRVSMDFSIERMVAEHVELYRERLS